MPASPVPFVFGKIPSRGDFIRAGTIPPLFDELDTWIQRSLLAHRPEVEEAPTVGFLMNRSAGSLFGAFCPSRDRAGRIYPLVVGAVLGPDQVPRHGDAVMALASHLSTALATARHIADERLSPQDGVDRFEESTQAAPTTYLDAPPARVFSTAAPAPILGRFLEAAGPFQNGAPAPRYGFGLPMPADPDDLGVALAFWSDVTHRLGTSTPLTFLWTTHTERPRLVLFFRTPTPDTLAYLLAGRPVDGVYDLDADTDTDPDSSPTLRSLLARF